jgi:chromosome partitioning protein
VQSVALANQKGGVGKTTTAIHLAHGLSLGGASVALFDLDPQGNATVALQGMGSDLVEVSRNGPLRHLRPVQQGLWLLGSPGAEQAVDRAARVDVPGLLRLALELEEAGIEWLIVDCPPRMDAWGWAGLQLCEQVLIPVQAEFFAMHGLSQMLRTLQEAQAEFPGKAGLMGVLPTLVDAEEAIAREVVQDLRKNLQGRVFRTVIFRDARFVEAASHGQTLFSYDPTAKGALCYAELIREVIDGRPQTGQAG